MEHHHNVRHGAHLFSSHCGASFTRASFFLRPHCANTRLEEGVAEKETNS